MKALCAACLQVVGGVFLVVALLQWVTYEYPDINPFRPGAIFAPGMLSQLFNFRLPSRNHRSGIDRFCSQLAAAAT